MSPRGCRFVAPNDLPISGGRAPRGACPTYPRGLDPSRAHPVKGAHGSGPRRVRRVDRGPLTQPAGPSAPPVRRRETNPTPVRPSSATARVNEREASSRLDRATSLATHATVEMSSTDFCHTHPVKERVTHEPPILAVDWVENPTHLTARGQLPGVPRGESRPTSTSAETEARHLTMTRREPRVATTNEPPTEADDTEVAPDTQSPSRAALRSERTTVTESA